jgi:3-oxoacyl-[acyl-carrier-protein] synthase-3
VSHHLPQLVRTSAEVEEKINVHLTPVIKTGSIERLTGIVTRRISREDEYNSTLAIGACRLLFKKERINPDEIDLLIFASTGQDILEPATAHIVQAEIGTHCRVMDIKNACNGFIDALDVAVSLIETGRHKKVLIATGEVPSKSAKFEVPDRDLLQQYLVGHTFGDCGTAVMVTKEPKIATVIDSFFFSDSSNWDVAMFPGGGSRFLNQRDAYFFRGDAAALMEPFFVHTKRLLEDFLRRNNISLFNIEHIFVHQVAEFVLDRICNSLEISKTRIQVTVKDYGNVAAASLPLGLDLRLQNQIIFSGTFGLFIGFAGGFSIGFTLVKF